MVARHEGEGLFACLCLSLILETAASAWGYPSSPVFIRLFVREVTVRT